VDTFAVQRIPNWHCVRQLIENVQKFGLRICSKQWDLGYDELLSNFSVPIAFSHINYITGSVQFLRLYIISSLFLHQFFPVMCIFNHLLTPMVFCTHLYLVLFLLGIHCQLMLPMHLLYLHLKPVPKIWKI